MKRLHKTILLTVILGILAAAGCKPAADLSMQRNRIFLLGRLLVNKTCDVRLIWRNAPGAVAPASVTADLTQIGGGAADALAPDANNPVIWRWRGQVTPDAPGERLITITAAGDADNTTVESKRFRVFDTDRTIAIASCYDHYLALKASGTVAAAFLGSFNWDNDSCRVPPDLTDAVAIAGWGDPQWQGGYSVALRADGWVSIWGSYYDPSGYSIALGDIVAIAARQDRVTALKANGTVIEAACEPDDYGWGIRCAKYAAPPGATDVVAIASGHTHTLALKADGTVVAWGINVRGECDVPGSLRNVVAIAGGDLHSLALKADGEVIAWGDGETAPRKIGRDFTAIAAGSSGFSSANIGLRKDGTVTVWWYGSPFRFYYVVNGLPATIAITPGMALAEDGSITGFTAAWDGISIRPVPEKLQ